MKRPAPAHPATARGLARDRRGRWLLVRPARNPRWWHIPGGLIEADESPAAACRREVREELGLNLEPGPLLVVGWNAPKREGSRARFTFVFDLGVHDADDLADRIRLQESELDAWSWVTRTVALNALHPDAAGRLRSWREGSALGYVEAPPTEVE